MTGARARKALLHISVPSMIGSELCFCLGVFMRISCLGNRFSVSSRHAFLCLLCFHLVVLPDSKCVQRRRILLLCHHNSDPLPLTHDRGRACLCLKGGLSSTDPSDADHHKAFNGGAEPSIELIRMISGSRLSRHAA